MDNNIFNDIYPFLCTEDGIIELYIKGQLTKEEFMRRLDEFRKRN